MRSASQTRNAIAKKFSAAWEPPSGPLILDMSPPRPPLPSKRLVIRSRKAPAQWSGGLFLRRDQGVTVEPSPARRRSARSAAAAARTGRASPRSPALRPAAPDRTASRTPAPSRRLRGECPPARRSRRRCTGGLGPSRSTSSASAQPSLRSARWTSSTIAAAGPCSSASIVLAMLGQTTTSVAPTSSSAASSASATIGSSSTTSTRPSRVALAVAACSLLLTRVAAHVFPGGARRRALTNGGAASQFPGPARRYSALS